MPRLPFSSAAPVLAGTIAAMAFALGAIAHDAGRRAAAIEPVFVARGEAPVFTGLPTVSRFEPVDQTSYTEITPPAGQDDRPVIALVIDDMGADEALSQRALELPAPVTFAILPYAEMSLEFDAVARALGHETLIHLPMQPSGEADPGPDALRFGQTPDEIRTIMENARDRVPGATGFNNHMGSALTADAEAMNRVFEAASGSGLYFLDSITTPRSEAQQSALSHGLTAHSRDIFIDHVNESGAISAQLDAIETRARERGAAIAIGHPRVLTLDALAEWIPDAKARGFRFVRLSELMEDARPLRLAASGEAPGFPGGAD